MVEKELKKRSHRLLVLALFISATLCTQACGGDNAVQAQETTTKPNPKEQPSPKKDAPLVAANTHASTQSQGARKLAIDLIDNRYLAHLSKNGVVVPLNDPGVVKFIQGAWKTKFKSQKNGGRRALRLAGRQGVLYVPMSERDCTAQDECTIYLAIDQPHSKQKITIFVNKTALPTRPVAKGFSVVSVKIPKGLLREGENRFRLFFGRSSYMSKGVRAAADLLWMAVVKSPDPQLESLQEIWRTGKGNVQEMNLLDLDAWSWYLPVPGQAELEIAWTKGKDLPVDVFVRAPGKKMEKIKGQTSGKRSARYAINQTKDHKILEIRIERRRPVELSRAAITVPKVPMTKIGKAPKHVLIWMIDTLRQDRLKAYNKNTRVKTPNLDELAKNGVVFERAVVQGGHSIPSHTSILSGLYTASHRHQTPKTRFKKYHPFQPQEFQAKKWRTLLLSSNGYVSKKWGFKRGFTDYKNFIRDGVPSQADRVWRWLEPWLSKHHKNNNLYAYVVTSDPHVAYRYRKEYTDQYDSGSYKGIVPKNATGGMLARIASGKIKLNARDKERLVALYDGEISFNDAYLGKMLNRLKELGIYDDTMIVIVSDHGEEFYEHGKVGHGHSLHAELINIPLIMHHPNGLPKGVRIEQGVEAMDVGTTLLKAVGITPPEKMQGADLIHLIQNHKVVPDRPIFAAHGAVSMAAQIGRYKMILKHGSNYQIYDHDKDPGEHKDVRGKYPSVERALKDALAFHLAYGKKWKKSRHGLPTNQSDVFAADAESWWKNLP